MEKRHGYLTFTVMYSQAKRGNWMRVSYTPSLWAVIYRNCKLARPKKKIAARSCHRMYADSHDRAM